MHKWRIEPLSARRPLPGGADRNPQGVGRPSDEGGRPLPGGADRNSREGLSDTVAVLSPPPRGRGSKHRAHGLRCLGAGVAPSPGARIETSSASGAGCSYGRSPPPRGRGSKRSAPVISQRHSLSPPPRGRGSKPQRVQKAQRLIVVAPSPGARIETVMDWPQVGVAVSSPPPRGRGSKQPDAGAADPEDCRPLPGGADRNLLEWEGRAMTARSPPPRGRGSKPDLFVQREQRAVHVAPSPGARIETSCPGKGSSARIVAPSPGARIETPGMGWEGRAVTGRPLPGGADRNWRSGRGRGNYGESPPPRGRGSKLRPRHDLLADRDVAPSPGARIETSRRAGLCGLARRRPLPGGADRNYRESVDSGLAIASPPPRGRGSKLAVVRHRQWLDQSPPPRGRGSKLRRAGRQLTSRHVAPSPGARIETLGSV